MRPYLLLPLLLVACQAPAQGPQDAAGSQPATSAASAPATAGTPVPSQDTTSEAQATAASPATAATTAAPAALKANVVRRWPHDTAAFTEGLQYVEGRFLESTGQVGQSGVRWVDPKTGRVLEQAATPTPGAFGEGVTFLNGRVYHLTWQDGEAYRLDQALQLQETYTYQGEGWGLAHDGQQLIMSNGSAALAFRDPDTFKVTREITVTDAGQPVTQLNELEWANGSIWANVWLQNRIARIDPQTGQVTGWLDASALAAEATQAAAAKGQQFTTDDVLNGIAYNAETHHFYLTGKRWPFVFEVQVSGNN
ncbi:glutaminyl-peptide cyclotransferase [Deinococcus sp. Marseille-Q6407]|uniref:glutaminyl-peptide cyclotransferase n=1 Tax=Deinococcus sp. Marseille-Q6407 TaxID=2969223 RepID=UPI0021C15764|nr:glutaminyl-peptide cyclotransferase [Deinococcus sp. Marseille-Q6407]